MVQSQFTEFSYGFAALYEMIHTLHTTTGLVAAPLLPTLRDENTLGFDAQVATVQGVLLLQFKCATWLKGPRAAERSTYGEPYYAFDLRNTRASPQHRLLCDLERSLPMNGVVRYVAPAFHTARSLDSCFRDGQVAARSHWVSPLALEPTDVGDRHRVCYRDWRDRPRRFSKEPVTVEASTSVLGIVEMAADWREGRGMALGDAVGTVTAALREQRGRGFASDSPAVDELRALAWSRDLHVVFVGDPMERDRPRPTPPPWSETLRG